jgi:hypothetical protein
MVFSFLHRYHLRFSGIQLRKFKLRAIATPFFIRVQLVSYLLLYSYEGAAVVYCFWFLNSNASNDKSIIIYLSIVSDASFFIFIV